MAAVYDIMRTIHISYQHPPALEDKNLSYDLKLVQSLQYPRNTIEKRSGTCIDLAILYAAMLNSVNIEPILVVIDGHCFPMARTPSGKLIPIEATGVGDGYEKGMSFEQAFKSASETLKKAEQSGRLVVVDVRQAWMNGVANPELDPMPADILEKWGIVALVESPPAPTFVTRADANGPPAAFPANNGGDRPAPAQPAAPTPRPTSPVVGRWNYSLQMMDGSTVTGQVDVKPKGGQLQMTAVSSYRMMGPDGLMHQVREKNNFVGALNGQNLIARCDSGSLTVDGQSVQPQGFPLQLSLVVSPDGRSMQGQVANSMGGRVPIYLQK
jgi:hypothetical protein